MPRGIVWFSLCIVGLCAENAARAGDYTFVTKQITDNSLDEFNPDVSGNNITWWAQTGATSATRDIFFYDGKSTTNLTESKNFEFYNIDPRISGSNVVWWGQPDGTAANQREIFYFDGKASTRITNDTVRDFPPIIDGATAVWEHGAGNDREIYRSNGAPLTSDGVVLDHQPDINGSRIAWVHGSGAGNKVLLYNGTTTVEAGSSTFAMNTPRVSDSFVVWQGFKNSGINSVGAEIYRYDGTNPLNPTNLSNNEFADFDPQVSGNKVVWNGGPFGVFDIYYNDGTTTTKISQDTTYNQSHKIDGNLVVWQGSDGHDLEIYAWDGASVIPLTDNDYDDKFPQLSGNHVVWEGRGTGSDPEIISARRVLFGDANFDGVVDGGDYTLWADNYLETDPPSALAMAAAVPEPSSITLVLIAAGACASAGILKIRPPARRLGK